ncbi:short-chain dehydrogenase [Tumebacillus avium]|uniref:Short-chain dehydrogenase n=1 Tax=Tumebacillus avium TaxID=1903704 RepID=A0A1Y0ILE8_9BACL|nr:SDR family oxidoreductase [Tumebacillus avium]ARU61347.1 short-chain dehydrogenase [Tumebacillus avium]
MKLSGNTVLITGGASGIGLAFAERFLKAGNEVIICGRREEKLNEAKAKFPELHTRVCNVASEADRKALAEWVKTVHPQVNVLVNNAGIQQQVNLLDGEADWGHLKQEITANFEAPVHLSILLLPLLTGKEGSTIINVTSGLAFAPAAWVPIYSATKAALHSFTLTLRHQVAQQNVEVIEVAPPAVNTDLGGVGLHTFGAPVEDFADAIFQGFERGDQEIGYGQSERSLRASRDELDTIFERMNNRE